MSLLPKLAEILQVTEHELITASIDNVQRDNVKNAKKWRTIVTVWDMFFYISYTVALFICFIVNLAVSKSLDWFFIVLSSLLVSATFTSIPKFIKKYRLLFIPLTQLAALFILFMTVNIYTGGNWFFIAALPTLLGFIMIFLPISIAHYNLPTLIKKHNPIITTLISFIVLCIMLIVIQAFAGGQWFFSVALPIASYALLIALIIIVPIRYLKLDNFFKTAIILAARAV